MIDLFTRNSVLVVIKRKDKCLLHDIDFDFDFDRLGALMLDEVAQNVDKLASSTTLPLLVIQGDNDRISPLSATQVSAN